MFPLCFVFFMFLFCFFDIFHQAPCANYHGPLHTAAKPAAARSGHAGSEAPKHLLLALSPSACLCSLGHLFELPCIRQLIFRKQLGGTKCQRHVPSPWLSRRAPLSLQSRERCSVFFQAATRYCTSVAGLPSPRFCQVPLAISPRPPCH